HTAGTPTNTAARSTRWEAAYAWGPRRYAVEPCRVSLRENEQGIQGDCSFALRIDDDRVQIDFPNARLPPQQGGDERNNVRNSGNIQGRRTAKPPQERCALEQFELTRKPVESQVRPHQAHVVQNLCLHASKSREHDGTPVWIVAAPDDQLRSAWTHALHQNAIQFKTGTMAGNVRVQAIPCLLDRSRVLKAQFHAAGIA